MSNLRTRLENFSLGGSPWADFDSEYVYVRKHPKTTAPETTVETSSVDETEQGVDDEATRIDPPKRPRSVALAVTAANAVHAAWEGGYSLGFTEGRLAGLNEALAIQEGTYDPPKAHYPDNGDPF